MIRSTKTFVLAATLFVFAAATASGQATRTWISGVGDDANPCSRTAPCKTFAGAISKTAAQGEIDVLDPGGFGALTITKSIQLDGTPVVAGVLVSGTNGIVVSAAPTDVVIIRGLDLNGLNTSGNSLSGVKVLQAKSVLIENCTFTGFLRGVDVSPNAANTTVVVRNSTIVANTSNGVYIVPTSPFQAQVTLENVRILNNVNNGITMTQGGRLAVKNSLISGNGLNGLVADGTGGGTTSADLDQVTIDHNGTGLTANNNAVMRVNDSSITGNGAGISMGAGLIFSTGNNRLYGNTVSNGLFAGPILTLQ